MPKDEFEQIEELAAQVLELIRAKSVDEQVLFEGKYRAIYPEDGEELVRLMVAKDLSQREGAFRVQAMNEVLTREVSLRIPAVYFRVLRIVKLERAKPVRHNKWNNVKRHSYAEIKAQQAKMAMAATRKMNRELAKMGPRVRPEPTSVCTASEDEKRYSSPPVGKPVQTFFADILNDVDHGIHE